ncbi:MAG: hypothetical protein H0U18_15585 [Pyrinomonadaceae bacterium]|nr:hypothetical protein [Pyrinomonadaceae bacterium]
MSDEHSPQVNESETVTPAERRNIWIWAIMLVILFAAAAVVSAGAVYKNRIAAIERHNGRMSTEVGEGGTKPPPTALPAGANPIRVQSGIYVDRIIDLSVKEARWTVDFYLWFRWNGTGVDPGENFQIVDGSIESKEKADEYTSGDERYVLYRVVARITKFFDVSRFPRDDHVLTINIESPASERRELLFVADKESSGVSSRVLIPGYLTYQQAVLEKPHAYRSTHGDPRLAAGTEKVQSQLRMGVWIHRQGLGFYLKMFVALFVAVGVALLAFFIKPTDVDPRFGLGVGALGAVIVNTYVISSLVPDTGVMTLADTVNHVGIVTIFLSLMQSAISLHLYERKGRKTLSRLFDRVSFVVFLAGYSVINLVLPWAATL